VIKVNGVTEDVIPAIVGAVRGVVGAAVTDGLDVDATRHPDGTWTVVLRQQQRPSLLPEGRFDFDPYDDLAGVLAATLERAFPR
jgi:hypothetical protein